MGPVEILVILLVVVLLVAGVYAAINALRRR
jgi:hypothetical protein